MHEVEAIPSVEATTMTRPPPHEAGCEEPLARAVSCSSDFRRSCYLPPLDLLLLPLLLLLLPQRV